MSSAYQAAQSVLSAYKDYDGPWYKDDLPKVMEAACVMAQHTLDLVEQYKHLENELDDMTGQFCNAAIHLTRAEDRVRELEEQYQAALDLLSRVQPELAPKLAEADELRRKFGLSGGEPILYEIADFLASNPANVQGAPSPANGDAETSGTSGRPAPNEMN